MRRRLRIIFAFVVVLVPTYLNLFGSVVPRVSLSLKTTTTTTTTTMATVTSNTSIPTITRIPSSTTNTTISSSLQNMINNSVTSLKIIIDGDDDNYDVGLKQKQQKIPASPLPSSSSSKSKSSWYNNSNIFHKACKIVYFIHIPKTGGTSMENELQKFTNYREIIRKELGYTYVSRGPKTIDNINRNVLLNRRNNSNNNESSTLSSTLSATSQNLNATIFTTAEAGIDTLKEYGYSELSNTCFFSIIRNPYEWIVSAENHMKIASKARFEGGFNKTYGYFDQDNIQSRMTGYYHNDDDDDNNNKKEKSSSSSSLILFRHQQNVCVFTINQIPNLIQLLWKNNNEVGDPPDLPYMNVRQHNKTIPYEAKIVVESKYNVDVELWEKVQNNGGTLCFYNK